MNFDRAFDLLMQHEGGYSDHPADPGGKTQYGVTERTARRHGYEGDMRDLPLSLAKRIARVEYWDSVRADEMPDAVRFDLFDAAYNSGPKRSIQWLQLAAGVATDGIIGPRTLSAARAANPHKLHSDFNGIRLEFLTSLETWRNFGRGWARRIASNLMGD